MRRRRAHERPVFVDHTGRRRRAVVLVGSGLGVLLAVGLVIITAGLLTGSPVPLPGWPDTAQREPVNTPTPSVSLRVTVSKRPAPVTTTAGPDTGPAPATTGPGNGNGNGNGNGRPTKSPGKPG